MRLILYWQCSYQRYYVNPITCNLYKLHIALSACKAHVTIACAACKDLNEQLILTLPVADQLYDQGVGISQDECEADYCSLHFNYDVNSVANVSKDVTVAVTTRAQS
jgi:hypothetical protein